MDQTNQDSGQLKLVVKWSSNEYEIDCLDLDNSVAHLKNCIYSKTGVKPERQKLMGLKMKNGLLFFIYQFDKLMHCFF